MPRSMMRPCSSTMITSEFLMVESRWAITNTVLPFISRSMPRWTMVSVRVSILEVASTSKVTFPGAGVSVMAASVDNIKYMVSLMTYQSISYDKVNQLRHVRYLKDKAHTLELMKKHAAILGPKFRAVLDALDREIAPLGIATWKRPTGGYFVSLDTNDGLAKRTLALCKEAGVVMTSAGATYPNGVDPRDRNIRIAPSLPPVAELEEAIDVFCVCLRLAALEKQLGK